MSCHPDKYGSPDLSSERALILYRAATKRGRSGRRLVRLGLLLAWGSDGQLISGLLAAMNVGAPYAAESVYQVIKISQMTGLLKIGQRLGPRGNEVKQG
jgi:hypothetical protein